VRRRQAATCPGVAAVNFWLSKESK
jgi:hypothetical protein